MNKQKKRTQSWKATKVPPKASQNIPGTAIALETRLRQSQMHLVHQLRKSLWAFG